MLVKPPYHILIFSSIPESHSCSRTQLWEFMLCREHVGHVAFSNTQIVEVPCPSSFNQLATMGRSTMYLFAPNLLSGSFLGGLPVTCNHQSCFSQLTHLLHICWAHILEEKSSQLLRALIQMYGPYPLNQGAIGPYRLLLLRQDFTPCSFRTHGRGGLGWQTTKRKRFEFGRDENLQQANDVWILLTKAPSTSPLWMQSVVYRKKLQPINRNQVRDSSVSSTSAGCWYTPLPTISEPFKEKPARDRDNFYLSRRKVWLITGNMLGIRYTRCTERFCSKCLIFHPAETKRSILFLTVAKSAQ